MARDLKKARDNSVATDGERVDVTDDPRGQSSADVVSELAADAYSIVVALVALSLSYWVLFRHLPAELFTLGLVATGLIVVNAVVAIRRQ